MGVEGSSRGTAHRFATPCAVCELSALLDPFIAHGATREIAETTVDDRQIALRPARDLTEMEDANSVEDLLEPRTNTANELEVVGLAVPRNG
jgi:hypothetical protein